MFDMVDVRWPDDVPPAEVRALRRLERQLSECRNIVNELATEAACPPSLIRFMELQNSALVELGRLACKGAGLMVAAPPPEL